MSFKIVEQAPARLNRSELAVPGSQPQLFEKAAKSAADVIFLDLEDAVAPDDKPQARKNVIQALRDIDWGNKVMSVRINGLDTHYMYRDVVDVIEQGGERLDLIMIPKVGTASDVYAVDMLVTQCEAATKRKKHIGFEMIIETALGMQNVHEIAAASKRNESLHFGVADYAASTKARTTNIGGANPSYAVLTDKDEHGDRDIHWEGKWAIHPSQVALANELFTPSDTEVTKARRILEAMAQAQKEGRGAVALDGRLIDLASIRQAEVLVAKAQQISGAH